MYQHRNQHQLHYSGHHRYHQPRQHVYHRLGSQLIMLASSAFLVLVLLTDRCLSQPVLYDRRPSQSSARSSDPRPRLRPISIEPASNDEQPGDEQQVSSLQQRQDNTMDVHDITHYSKEDYGLKYLQIIQQQMRTKERKQMAEMVRSRKPRALPQKCVLLQAHPKRRSSRMRKRFVHVSKWHGKMDNNDALHLKWLITSYSKKISKQDTRNTVKGAFKLWEDQITIPSLRTMKLDFTEAQRDDDSDISLLWAEGDHGDPYPFDGAGNSSNILAHTFYPDFQSHGRLNGDIHFDESENWTLDPNIRQNEAYFPYVLVHEIGHALGLGHSKRQEAVMNPIYKQIPLSDIVLDIDDKCALHWNYIGPTNTCLFVWLMVELLPRAKDGNVTTNGIASMASIAEEGSAFEDDAKGTSRRRRAKPSSEHPTEATVEIEQVLRKLQESTTPTCQKNGATVDHFVAVLKERSRSSTVNVNKSRHVICQFLEGLSEVLQRRKKGERCWKVLTTAESETSAAAYVTFCTTDPQKPFASAAVRSPEPLLKVSDHPGQDLTASAPEPLSPEAFVRSVNLRKHFEREDFDEQFFVNVLQLLFDRHELRRRRR